MANLTPWALVRLLGDEGPSGLRRRVKNLKPISSAFMAYLGVDEAAIEDEIDHHQVIVDQNKPLGEGNSVFVSISPKWDHRAPQGQRAITISTHTRVAEWYALANDEQAFEDRKQLYLERLIEAASIALPKLKQNIRLAMPGTPLTFERFTHRVQWYGGRFSAEESVGQLGAARSRSGLVVGGRQRVSGAIHRGGNARRIARGP